MKPAPLSPARDSSYVLVGRYAIFDEIAAGGMATVHLGRLWGAGGFSRVVAIKRLHPQFAKDAEFSAMFKDEARLAARIQHANVVQTLDVVTVDKELLLVMEYVHGVSFAALLHGSRKARQRVDPRIAAAVVVGALEGLHAAHEAKSEVGLPLGVVHRDVSPQNVMVGADGVPRILDFGVAKAVGKMHATREGQLKGKLAYMSPEQVRSLEVTRQSDVFSAAIVLWEALMGQRLFDGNNPAELIMQVISETIEPPCHRFPDLPPALDAVVMKGLARDPAARYATARDMAIELEAALAPAPAREVARWAEGLAAETLKARSQLVERIERTGQAGGRPQAPGQAGGRPQAPGQAGGRPQAPGQAGGHPASTADDAATSGLALAYAATLDGSMQAPGYDRGLADESGTRARPGAGRGVVPAGGDTPPPISDASPGLPAADPVSSPAAPAARARRIPVHVEPEETPLSLRERIETPLKVIAAGVLLSVADPLVRPFLGSFPVRPLWVAEALVIAGVLWIVARLVLPVRSARD